MTEHPTDAKAIFTDYFVRNYPGPKTIIGDPTWHAPRIFRAAQHAMNAARTTPIDDEGLTIVRRKAAPLQFDDEPTTPINSEGLEAAYLEGFAKGWNNAMSGGPMKADFAGSSSAAAALKASLPTPVIEEGLCDKHGTPFISPGICPFCQDEQSIDIKLLSNTLINAGLGSYIAPIREALGSPNVS